MAFDNLRSGEKRALFFFENLTRLLSYRTLDEILAEALSLLVNTYQAAGGSIIYVSTLSKNVRQGELEGPALQQIDLWEDALCKRLHRRTWGIQLPSAVPVTKYLLPNQEGTLLTLPLIGRDRICGAISLFLPTAYELEHQEEVTLSRFASGVCAIANNVEQLTVTRQRLSQLGLFYQMGQTMTSTFDINQLFEDTIELAIAVIDAQAAVLTLFDPKRQELVHKVSRGGSVFPQSQRIRLGDGIAGWVARSGQPVLLNNATRDDRFDAQIDGFQEHVTRSLLCVPLQIKGRVIGVLEVLNKTSPFEFDEEDMSVLITLAAQTAIALDNARLYNSLRAERDRIIEAQESTRHELARNLHDGPVQLLAALAMGLDYLERAIKAQPEAIEDELNFLRGLTRQATRDARMLMFELRPVILETQGLVPTLQSYVERLSASDRFTPHFDPGNFASELDPRVAGTVFSIIQEAVNNIQKHAKASNVWIRLREESGELVVSVEDDGKGFDVESVLANYDQGSSFGLLNMRERAELIDGVLKLVSSSERQEPGTLIQLTLPKPEESGNGGPTNESPDG